MSDSDENINETNHSDNNPAEGYLTSGYFFPLEKLVQLHLKSETCLKNIPSRKKENIYRNYLINNEANIKKTETIGRAGIFPMTAASGMQPVEPPLRVISGSQNLANYRPFTFIRVGIAEWPEQKRQMANQSKMVFEQLKKSMMK